MSSSVKPQRGDGSPGVLFRLPLQIFRRVREKAKEDRAAYRHDKRTHFASLVRCWSGAGRVSRRVALGRRRDLPPALFPQWPGKKSKRAASASAKNIVGSFGGSANVKKISNLCDGVQ